jgi:hypothetical protein
MTEQAMGGTDAGDGAAAGFSDPRVHARWAVRVLRACIGGEIVSAAIVLGFLMAVRSFEQGGDPARIVALLSRASMVAMPLTGLLQLAALFTCTYWLGKAHANLPALGARRLRYRPRWAIFAWVIPVANLALPYLVTDEVWRASVPGDQGTEWRSARGGPRVAAWWALVLIMLALATTVIGADASPETRREQYAYLTTALLSTMAALFACMAALRVVRDVNDRQMRTAAERGLGAGT